MELKVNYSGLEEVESITKSNKELLEIEINTLLNSLERIKNLWKGDDSDIFYDNCSMYINKMKILCEFMQATTTLIGNACDKYEGEDIDFSESLEKEVEMLNDQTNYY